MASYNTSDLRKGLKVQIEGVPFLILECLFVKPGKGQALYKMKLQNILRGTTIERTLKSGDSIDAADVHDQDMQFLYRNGDNYVFMDPESFEQPELPAELVGDHSRWLKDGLMCKVTFFNDKPIAVEPPKQMVLRVTHSEPGARGNTATNVTKEAELETGAKVQVPIFIEVGDLLKIDTATGEYIERVREK
jgi:elongation factor P